MGRIGTIVKSFISKLSGAAPTGAVLAAEFSGSDGVNITENTKFRADATGLIYILLTPVTISSGSGTGQVQSLAGGSIGNLPVGATITILEAIPGLNNQATITEIIKEGVDKNAQFISTMELHGDQRTSQVFGPCNEDFAPPENGRAVNIPVGKGRGFLVSVAYHNQEIDPVALAGESRKYSTDATGAKVMAEVFLKQDGTILLKNAITSLEMLLNGTIILQNTLTSINILPAGGFIVSVGGTPIFEITAAGGLVLAGLTEINMVASEIKMNGTGDNLVMWTALNAALQALVVQLQAHTHAGGTVPPPDQTFTLDITGAKADTLKTDG